VSGQTTGPDDTPADTTLFGVGAGSAITTGSSNTFVGFNAGSTTTTGSNNTIVGVNNVTNATSNNSVIIGFNNGTSGTDPYGLGSGLIIGSGNMLSASSTPNSGVFIGRGIVSTNEGTKDPTNGLVIGINSGSRGCRYNTIIGHNSCQFQTRTNSTDNTVIGYNAFQQSGYASENVVIGQKALSEGSQAPGSDSLYRNIVIGSYALTRTPTSGSTRSTSCDENILIGYDVGNSLTGSQNIFIGSTAGNNINGATGNVILGPWAGDGAARNGDFIVAPGGTVVLRINNKGAFSPGGLNNFGSSGQILKSVGSNSAPVWSNVASAVEGEPALTFTSSDGKVITVENGLITSIEPQ
jgi:hypothetical protein